MLNNDFNEFADLFHLRTFTLIRAKLNLSNIDDPQSYL